MSHSKVRGTYADSPPRVQPVVSMVESKNTLMCFFGAKLNEKQTPWNSIWTTAAMLVLVGLQFSVYLTSTWQYLKTIHPNPSMDLFGMVMASVSLACALANAVFGYWNQKTMSTKNPLTLGFTLAALGNLWYAQLPILPASSLNIMVLFSRFLTGFGAGTMGVLRSFMATASTRQDRLKAVSLGTAGLTAGLSLGPVLQICFLPLGTDGFFIGPFLINTYTGAAYFMCFTSCLAVFVANFVLIEDYAGIISDKEKKEDPFIVIPHFDRVAVALIFFYWWAFSGVASTEGIASAIAMSMYNWKSEEAVLYSGAVQTLRCVCSTMMYILLGATRVGAWDRRYHLTIGLLGFLFFHTIHLPWPFYDGPLDRTPIENGTVHNNAGGCSWEYDWCDYTPRVPKLLYLSCASVVLGFAFPLIAAPCNTILSEVLGPRKQGMIQGMFALTGSMCQFVVPIVSAYLFKTTGYVFIMTYHVVILCTSLILLLFLRKRLVALCMLPKTGSATRYKLGTLYRL